MKRINEKIDKIFEGKKVPFHKLKRGDVIETDKGPFYVHWTRTNRRYTAIEVSDCPLDSLKNIDDKFQMSTWKFRNRDTMFNVIDTVSTALQNKFQAAEDEYQQKKAERETQQMKAIEPKWKDNPASRRGGDLTIRAKDGKYYKAGDVVDVAWSNGTSPAILGNLEGRLYNLAGEVAVLDIRGINWGKAKARFLPPEYIVGKSDRADQYNVKELLQKAGASKSAMADRRAHKQSIMRQFRGF